jgi:hypothetical protein
MGISVMGIRSTRTNQGLRFQDPDSSTASCKATAAAGLHERLALLEAVVASTLGTGQIACGDGTAVQRGHDAHLVRGDVADGQVRGLDFDAQDDGAVTGDDLEQRRVDPVGAGGEEPQLAAALAAVAQERLGVLEVITGHLAGQDALGRDAGSVGGHDQRDLPGRNDHHRHAPDLVLPDEQPQVPAGGQQARLVAGLTVEGDQTASGQRGTKALDHQARFVLTDDPDASEQDEQQDDSNQTEQSYSRRVEQEGKHCGTPFAPQSRIGRAIGSGLQSGGGQGVRLQIAGALPRLRAT